MYDQTSFQSNILLHKDTPEENKVVSGKLSLAITTRCYMILFCFSCRCCNAFKIQGRLISLGWLCVRGGGLEGCTDVPAIFLTNTFWHWEISYLMSSITKLKHWSFCVYSHCHHHVLISVIQITGCQGWTHFVRCFLASLHYYYTCLSHLLCYYSFMLIQVQQNQKKKKKFPPHTHFMSLSPGNEPQTEKQVEKVSTLSLVRRDTALLLRDFRQGASNWIHSLLDPNRASASPSTAAEAPPGATGIPPSVTLCAWVCVCSCICSQVGTLGEMWAGREKKMCFAWRLLYSKFPIDTICWKYKTGLSLRVGVYRPHLQCIHWANLGDKSATTSTGPKFICSPYGGGHWLGPFIQHSTNQLSLYPTQLHNTRVVPFISIHLFGAAGLWQ